MELRPRKIIHLSTFEKWFFRLKDTAARGLILTRLDKIEEEGHFGSHRFVGDGVWELKIHYGPGYRVYYGEEGPLVILLLLGGDKSSQNKDICASQKILSQYRRQK